MREADIHQEHRILTENEQFMSMMVSDCYRLIRTYAVRMETEGLRSSVRKWPDGKFCFILQIVVMVSWAIFVKRIQTKTAQAI